MAVAVKELRETEENVKNGIETLRKLLQGKTIVSYAISIISEKRYRDRCDIYWKNNKEKRNNGRSLV